MHTFDTSPRTTAFWLAVILPPVGYWGVVQLFAYQAGAEAMPLRNLAVLVTLATALPLMALTWMLCSVAAYTITPRRLIEHRVVRDREFAFGNHLEVHQLTDGVIVVKLPQQTLHLHVTEPARCLALLREAEKVVREGEAHD